MFKFDPRTKIFLLFIVVLSLLFTRTISEEAIIVVSVAVFAVVAGKPVVAITGGAFYFLTLLITTRGVYYLPEGVISISVTSFFIMNQKMTATAMIGLVLLLTTKTDELVSAMNKLRISTKITVPFTVMLRYLPAIYREWSTIREAFLLRSIDNKKKSWIEKIRIYLDFLYVPLLISASDLADDLAISAIIRGIENPAPKTSITKLAFQWFDIFFIAGFLLIFSYLIIS